MISSISKYQIEGILGEGGMGKVYLGRDLESGEQAAIKELHPIFSKDPEIRMRFRREALAMSSLDHPNIVKFFELLDYQGGLYLIMEYAEGRSLDNYISEVTGPIPEDRVIEIFEKILDAFSYAHNRKIVHRDIKPANIVISDNLDIKVLDFGIAKILDSTDIKSTNLGTVIGTSCYMSPEQAQGLTIDTRTDIYSLGILLFYMLTGQPPFDTGTLSDYDVRLKVVRDSLPKAQEVYRFASDRLQKVIDTATDKNLMLRFKNCEEFRMALKKEEEGKKDATAKNSITIGRSENCDIISNSSLVSRIHAIVTFENGQYFYKDISINGTLINGIKIQNKKFAIKNTDTILLSGEEYLVWEKIIALLPASNAQRSINITTSSSKKEKAMGNASKKVKVAAVTIQKKEGNLHLWIAILSLIVPPFGLGWYFTQKKYFPDEANWAGTLGLIGIVCYLVLHSFHPINLHF